VGSGPKRIPQDINVYFGVHPLQNEVGDYERGKNSDIYLINALFADFDDDKLGGRKRRKEHTANLPVEPSARVETGGGEHCYWFLDKPYVIGTDVSQKEAERIQEQWVEFVSGDDAAKDLARILRLPGSMNHKYDPPRPCTLTAMDAEKTYTLKELTAMLPRRTKENGTRRGRRIDNMRAFLKGAGAKVERVKELKFGKLYVLESCPFESAHTDGSFGFIRMNDGYTIPECKHNTCKDLGFDDIREEFRKAMPKQQKTYGLDDTENAQATLDRHPNKFLYTETHGWLWYENGVWTRELSALKVERSVSETLQWRVMTALKTNNSEAVKRCAPNTYRVKAIMSRLQMLCATTIREFTPDPDLLNCKNGVVDLRTGELLPHSPDYRFMHQTNVNYNPDADRLTWLAFLQTVAERQEVIDHLQMLVGYSFTGHISDEIAPYIYGPTRSGKGVFTETLQAIAGDTLAKEISFDVLTQRKHADDQGFALAPLKDARLVFASESKQRQRLDEAKLKRITGGNEVHCAFKHKDFFSYRPTYTVWMTSNFDVNADPDDDAVWGRLRLISFPNSFLGNEDTKLKETMRRKDVLEGVLAWAVDGAIYWNALHDKGMRIGEVSGMASKKQALRNALDHVGEWATECLADEEGSIALYSDAYRSYRHWCKDNGVSPKYKNGFSDSLRAKGYEIKKRAVRVAGKPRKKTYISDVYLDPDFVPSDR
jgi:putative DNA primase/helicase